MADVGVKWAMVATSPQYAIMGVAGALEATPYAAAAYSTAQSWYYSGVVSVGVYVGWDNVYAFTSGFTSGIRVPMSWAGQWGYLTGQGFKNWVVPKL